VLDLEVSRVANESCLELDQSRQTGWQAESRPEHSEALLGWAVLKGIIHKKLYTARPNKFPRERGEIRQKPVQPGPTKVLQCMKAGTRVGIACVVGNGC
jgi:hypothetical protein